ncbi:hypothetical protein [Marinoscillum sp. 108]|uniref:hypothetical protein n=1 Tax=Marinoscillum sp. 108 TaxID=2653151 RepID=UPI0012EFEFA5|nr:hypothetical protein [Marinoscillum sp. 108]VXD10883.1 conserved hypothetical protein [Marinoscillum sp. 108]
MLARGALSPLHGRYDQQYDLRLVFVLATLTNFQIALACDCKEQGGLKEAQKSNYEDSELIFMGRVIELNDDGTFKFEILETFKGSERKYIELKQTHLCSILPSEDEEYWLVYIDDLKNKESAITSSCGLSRSFRYPYLMNVNDLPPPPPSTDAFLQLESEIMMSEHRTKSLEILKGEIEQLRKWKSGK